MYGYGLTPLYERIQRVSRAAARIFMEIGQSLPETATGDDGRVRSARPLLSSLKKAGSAL